MRAELMKNQESVRFVWDEGELTKYEVHIYKFDLNRDCFSHHDEIMTRLYAKGYWRKLVKLGFKRNTNTLPTNDHKVFPRHP